MYLMISTQHPEASALGYLLHKHPDKLQRFALSFGQALVFYPIAQEDHCAAVLMLELDPIALSRGQERGQEQALKPYVNDRPYVASSFLSVAISRVLGTALGGRCQQRPELVGRAWPFEVSLPVLSVSGGAALLEGLFEPLGYEVEATPLGLDPQFPQWGEGKLWALKLRGVKTLEQLLTHLYVLIPVMDDEKHYYIGQDEVEKLLRHGQGWLEAHPMKAIITRRYLERRRSLVEAAMQALEAPSEEQEQAHDAQEEQLERPLTLHQQRLDQVLDWLKESGARRVVDLGCGEGKLLGRLLSEGQFEEIVGVDVSARTLQIAAKRLKLERMPALKRARLTLKQGSLVYTDQSLVGYDAAALVEVIEHVEPERLGALEEAIFGVARPKLVIVTTPNQEYNARFEALPAGKMRHKDHRFEWTRQEFQAWVDRVCARYGYRAEVTPLGQEDEALGAPSQAARFYVDALPKAQVNEEERADED